MEGEGKSLMMESFSRNVGGTRWRRNLGDKVNQN